MIQGNNLVIKRKMSTKADKKIERNKFRYKGIIIILFILVLGIVIYTSFFNSDWTQIEITGDFLSSELNPNESVNINANLSMDSLELEGVFDKVIFTSVSQINVKIGKSNFKTKNNSKIILEDYEGEIVFDSKKIIKLDGDADRIETEGGSYEEETDISLENLKYKNLKIEDVYIRKFEQPVSGIVDVEGTYASLDNDNLLMKKFKGTISSKGLNNSVYFKGMAKGIESETIKAGSLGLFSNIF